MATIKSKYFKSKYKYVRGVSSGTSEKISWQYCVNGFTSRSFETEFLAAKAADIHLIQIGREPVNILKRPPIA